MENGFYLSTYLEINSYGNIYKIAQRHHHNLSLWRKTDSRIELVHYWELERITGIKKHRVSFFDVEQARNFINNLLANYNLSLNDIKEVWGTPELQTSNDYFDESELGQITFHAMSHLFSSLLLDSDIFYNEDMLALSIDAGSDNLVSDISDKQEYAGAISTKGDVSLFPVSSPGVLWNVARETFDLEEGSLMALASACKEEIEFPFDNNLSLMKNTDGEIAKTYIESLIGYAEDHWSEIDQDSSYLTLEERKISVVMKEIQKTTVKIMENTIDHIIGDYHLDPTNTYLALSGGVALNCPMNNALMQKYNFKGFVAPPCVNDTGQSLGIALYAFYRKMEALEFKLNHAFYGDQDKTEKLLINPIYEKFIKSTGLFSPHIAVKDIIQEPIVWFDGAAEIGPRALGNRSILADPRNPHSKDKLNEYKQRQWWRPVAPIVLESEMSNWFEGAYPSPYMLHTFQIRKDCIEKVPAIAHLDDSARLQSLSEATEQTRLYALLNEFLNSTGVPIICNTSLNDKQEPIINTVEEAMNFALRKGIKIAYLNGVRIELHNHTQYDIEKPLQRKPEVIINEEELENLQKTMNPHNIPLEGITNYLVRYYPRGKELDLTDRKNARFLTLDARFLMKQNNIKSITFD
ncbi:Carbamoyltransferase N-terminus [Paenibacillus sp. CF095]|uniref:carbamoyltransferase C-terminal domain-containing protein n=1 Tax=Paenibacillus sp. CF095 TaxID=1881033 RepID=UPI000883425A|nr:carbamoyltransferase C-terminal domain-containing protein [Paenibacillus sp. CF095]SDD50723.1 Carbamoyltransferase N-terminus [Paenibacillus sp. CF095]